MWLLTPSILQATSLSLLSVTLDPNSSSFFFFRTVCNLQQMVLASETNWIKLKYVFYEFVVQYFGPCLAKEGRKCRIEIVK